jgi:acyl carrier protein
MEKTEIFEIIKELLQEKMGLEDGKVTEASRFKEDLGTDSLDDIEIIMQIEDEFDIEIPDEEIDKMSAGGGITVSDVVALVAEK